MAQIPMTATSGWITGPVRAGRISPSGAGESGLAHDRFESSPGDESDPSRALGRLAARGGFSGPAEVATGRVDYYRDRNNDFLRRHPEGTPAPDYYLNYGDKYARRFTQQVRPNLSDAGKKWLDQTFINLQEAIENKRRQDPAAFARLEEDPDAFRRFAYETHARAYLDAGLEKLPSSDLVKIGSTPDFRDLFTKDGVGQMGEVLGDIYSRRGLDYFKLKAVQGAIEFGNPVTGPSNLSNAVQTAVSNHAGDIARAGVGVVQGMQRLQSSAASGALWLGGKVFDLVH